GLDTASRLRAISPLPSCCHQTAMSDATRTSAFVRLAAFYAATFAVLGVYMQFFPLWLHDARGLSEADVAFVLSGQIWARTIAGPVWAQRVDRTGNARRVLCVLVALSCL